MIKIILLRHGESTWNKENRFTGWTDVDLSEKGVEEAHEAAQSLQKEGLTFDIAFTSVLKRATRTLDIVLKDMKLKIPIRNSWCLNERHYGALQGLNKSETAQKYGEEQVKIWRRSYDIRPPALALSDKRHPRFDQLYKKLKVEELPSTECLKDTVARVLPFWNSDVVPVLKQKKRVIIAAHGNSIRALVKYLDSVSDEDIVELNIPTGIPLVYELDEYTLKAKSHFYLGDQTKIREAMEKVAKQGAK